jgi:hypothetical protein
MWFRFQYRDTVGKAVGYLCWARDPEMLTENMRRHQIFPGHVETLLIDQGQGFESWKPALLQHIMKEVPK